MGYTLVEKILMKNAGVDHVSVGDIVITRPDMFMVHDIYTCYLVDALKNMETEELDDPSKVTIIFDHCMPTAVAKNDSAHYDAGIYLTEKYGLDRSKIHIGEGICHSDSHTTTYGGAGCFCTGIGTTEMAAALTTGELWFKVPEAIKIVLKGHLKPGVTSKDVILKILGDIRSDGGQYKSLEFVGPAIKDLCMDARFTVSNMALEAGAKCALFPADERTAEYYDMDYSEIEWVHPDEDAEYEQVLEYDLDELEPQLSCPQGVDNVHSMRIAAEVLKGKKAAPYVRLIVAPATNKVYKEAIKAGYIRTFVEAGAVIIHPCCGLCCGMPYGLLADDEVILSTANRNFIGRMGTKKTLIYLGSPAMAAYSAIKGEIADPREACQEA